MLPQPEIVEHLPETVLLRHRVGVHPLDSRLGQHAVHGLLDPLRAEAPPADFRGAALRARGRRRLLLAAEVALQRLVRAVVGQRDAAMRTPHHMAALLADQARE